MTGLYDSLPLFRGGGMIVPLYTPGDQAPERESKPVPQRRQCRSCRAWLNTVSLSEARMYCSPCTGRRELAEDRRVVANETLAAERKAERLEHNRILAEKRAAEAQRKRAEAVAQKRQSEAQATALRAERKAVRAERDADAVARREARQKRKESRIHEGNAAMFLSVAASASFLNTTEAHILTMIRSGRITAVKGQSLGLMMRKSDLLPLMKSRTLHVTTVRTPGMRRVAR